MSCLQRGTEYLEDLVTCIDAPQLNVFKIVFFDQINFDTPRLAQFIDRTKFWACDEAHVLFDDFAVIVELMYRSHGSGDTMPWIEISHTEPDWQLSSIVQVCNSSLLTLSSVEDLYIEHQ